MIAELARSHGVPVQRLPLWAVRFPASELVARAAANPRSYQRGMRQRAATDEERTFPSVEKCVVYGRDSAAWVHPSGRCFSGVDLSSKTRPGTWIVTLARDPDATLTIVDARRGRWTSPETLRQIGAVDAAFHPVAIGVESNALQKGIIEWASFEREQFAFWGRIQGHHTGSNKTSEEMGVPSLEIGFSAGAWRIPFRARHRPDCDCGMCELLFQFVGHPLADHTDAVMATWIAATMAQLFGAGRVIAGVSDPSSPEEIERIMAEREVTITRMAAEYGDPS